MEKISKPQLLLRGISISIGVLATIVGAQVTAAPSVEVKVVPRIGLFSQFLYQELYSRSTGAIVGCTLSTSQDGLAGKLSWPEYYKALPEALKKKFKPDAGKPDRIWDLLVTDAYSAAPGEGCGYGVRRAFVSVKGLSDRHKRCRFSIDPAATFGACSREFALSSNLEKTITVEIEGERGSIPATIPEDFLIVALGDSFASGEGNPDSTGGSDVAWRKYASQSEKQRSAPPIWMDPWCHRSAWSGPIQAGLLLAKDRSSLLPKKQRESIEAGAITIANIACSGAKIRAGVLREYQGVRPLPDILSNYSAGQGKGDELDMGGQLDQLKRLLDRQLPGVGKKTTIDLMTLSGGGNDLLFGPKLIEEILGPYFSSSKQDRAAKDIQFANFRKMLPDWYTDLDTALAEIGKAYTLRQILLTGYPDPFWESEGRICEGPVVSSYLARKISKTFLKVGVNREGAQALKQELFDVLNAEALKPTRRWLTIDPMAGIPAGDKDDVRKRGWCVGGSISHDYSEPMGRWFRNAEDSYYHQGNLAGAFHPTWEAHTRLYAKRIFETLKASLAAEPTGPIIEFDPPVALASGGRKFIAHNVKVMSVVERPERYSIRVQIGDRAVEACPNQNQGCAAVDLSDRDGAVLNVIASSRSLEFKRAFGDRSLGEVVVDATPPQLTCNGQPIEKSLCAGAMWTKERYIRIDAIDNGSGLRGEVSWEWFDNSGTRTANERADSLPQTLNLSEGQPELAICVQDRVGHYNIAGCRDRRLLVKVDHTPPKVTIRAINGIVTKLQDKALPSGPIAIPAFAGSQVELDLVVHEEVGSKVERINTANNTRTCDESWLLDRPLKVAAAANEPYSADLEFRDCAGNPTKPIRIVPIARRSGAPVRSVGEWLADTGDLPQKGAILGELSAIGNISDREALSRLDEGRQAIAAAWLNMLDGRIDPYTPRPPEDDAFCDLILGGNRYPTAYELLLRLDRCVASQEGKDQFIADIKDKVKHFGFVK